MDPPEVVLLDVFRYDLAQFGHVPVLGLVDAVVLQVPEPPLDEDVVGPASHAVHRLADAVPAQAVDVGLRGIGGPLVGVADRGAAVLVYRALHAEHGGARLERVVKVPAHDEAAVPVDDR